MKSRSMFLGAFLVLLAVVALVHLAIYLAFYGTGFKGFAEKGISGLAVGGNEMTGNLPVSEVILFLEWGLIFLGVVFVYAKYRIDLKKEFSDLVLLKEKKPFSGGTELDRFYGLLKDMKHFRLATAARVFDVDIEVMEDWAQSLESSKVAELTYPRLGGPEIKLIEGASPKYNRNEEDEAEEEQIKKDATGGKVKSKK